MTKIYAYVYRTIYMVLNTSSYFKNIISFFNNNFSFIS